MTRISLTSRAHQLIAAQVNQGDSVIDATVGNGYDTVFLANLVGSTGRVYGFDIQQRALDITTAKLSPNASVSLIKANHADLLIHIPSDAHGKISAVMFNLGYLPSGDKHIITTANTTVLALTAACTLLAKGGIITVLAYPGHAGGDLETQQGMAWCLQLNPDCFAVSQIDSIEIKANTPVLLIIRKIGASC